jgi:hypothetical protein
MGLITNNKVLTTLEEGLKFPSGLTTMTHVQQTTSSKLYRRYLKRLKFGGSQLGLYFSQEFDGNAATRIYVARTTNKRSGEKNIKFYELRFDALKGITYYNDSKGNEWKKEWGIAIPYGYKGMVRGILEKIHREEMLINETGEKYTTALFPNLEDLEKFENSTIKMYDVYFEDHKFS